MPFFSSFLDLLKNLKEPLTEHLASNGGIVAWSLTRWDIDSVFFVNYTLSFHFVLMPYFFSPFYRKLLKLPKKLSPKVFATVLALFFFTSAWLPGAHGQKKNRVFQTGERLTYKVKFGFVKLGTLVMETGEPVGSNLVKARMKFWTAQVPFLDSKDIVDDVIDTSALCLMNFEEHGNDGETKLNRTFFYDPAQRTISYSDATVKNRITENVRPFSDAVALFFNLRTWSGSGGKYFFPMRGRAGEKFVNCHFTLNEKEQECPAFEDKEIQTYVVEGHADMGDSAPLGASGKFTAYITKDDAAIPIRIEMKIAIGSISLILDKVQRTNWQP